MSAEPQRILATVADARLRFTDLHPPRGNAVEELLAGLREPPRSISPKFFYDGRGSALFERITELPEYYLTRTENAILAAHAAEIAAAIGPGAVIVEPGSGGSTKVRHLLASCAPRAYVPIDISREPLLDAAAALAAEFETLEVHAVCADFNDALVLPADLPPGRRVAFHPGSTLGNLERDDARRFLLRLGRLVGADGALVIGVDLQKDPATLLAAYDDAQGVTAQFNRNILVHANRLLGADFDPGAFDHLARYDEALGRIEIFLRSRRDQTVCSPHGSFRIGAGELIHTEYSHKYTERSLLALAADAGLRGVRRWSDPRQYFAVHYLETAV